MVRKGSHESRAREVCMNVMKFIMKHATIILLNWLAREVLPLLGVWLQEGAKTCIRELANWSPDIYAAALCRHDDR